MLFISRNIDALRVIFVIESFGGITSYPCQYPNHGGQIPFVVSQSRLDSETRENKRRSQKV